MFSVLLKAALELAVYSWTGFGVMRLDLELGRPLSNVWFLPWRRADFHLSYVRAGTFIASCLGLAELGVLTG